MYTHKVIKTNIPAYLLRNVYQYNLTNPTVEHVLCHIFFTNGNGLDFDKNGNLVEFTEKKKSRKAYYDEAVAKLKDKIKKSEDKAREVGNIYGISHYLDNVKRLASLQATKKIERYIIKNFHIDVQHLEKINWYAPTQYSLIHLIKEIPQSSEWYNIFKLFIQATHGVLKYLETKNLMYGDFYERIPDDKLRWKPIIEEYFTILFPEESERLKKRMIEIKREEDEKRARFK